MTVLRQFLALFFIPLMLWAGLPQIACRCSTGEFRLHCPLLGQQSSASQAGNLPACCFQAHAKVRACCAHRGEKNPLSPSKTHSVPPDGASQPSKDCTPVLLQAEFQPVPSVTAPVGSTSAWFVVPELVQIRLTPAIEYGLCAPCSTSFGGNAASLHERWLV